MYNLFYMGSDLGLIITWWAVLLAIGAAAYPLTRKLFSGWFDRGYLFSKAVGLVTVSYLVWLGGSLHIVPFTVISIIISTVLVFFIGLALTLNREFRIENKEKNTNDSKFQILNSKFIIFVCEELFFLAALTFWVWIKAHEPSIHGLEKFMDFGFAKSILNGRYFPPADMWYAGGTVNYYYYGHYIMALLTKLSGIDLRYTFNLMLSTLFAFTLTMSFSIGVQLYKLALSKKQVMNGELRIANNEKEKSNHNSVFSILNSIFAGLLTAFLVTSAGNMQTIYAFTKGYGTDTPIAFWKLLWPVGQFWQDLPQGLNSYWYANATRFIPYTIHEFPGYSFVVSDVHGHVLSLPFVLLAIALLMTLFAMKGDSGDKGDWIERLRYGFYGLLLAVLFMTNVLDAPIYGGLIVILILLSPQKSRIFSLDWFSNTANKLIPVALSGVFIIPFLLNFKSFVTGLAVNCPPANLANNKFGPILFEGVEKCQHSPFWMMWLLWGFFWFCGLSLIISRIKIKYSEGSLLNIKFTHTERVLVILFIYCLGLIIFPEFFYFKDIYPMHFRSNTMFKLGYQAYIMFSIISGYAIIKLLSGLKAEGRKQIAEKTKLINSVIHRLPSAFFLILLVP
jgi:YYY domain-containing protein